MFRKKTFLALLLILMAACLVAACGDDDDDDDDHGVDDDTAGDDDAEPDDDEDDDLDDDSDDDDDLIPPTTEGFSYVPPGVFSMGSPEDEPGRRDNEALHQVSLSHGIEVMSREVTQEEFELLMGHDPSHFPVLGASPLRPVEQVSWFDALAFANRMSERDGYETCYLLGDILCADGETGDEGGCADQGGIGAASVALNGVDSVYDCAGFRLPTEAEWEYAARAGATGAFYNGDITHTACDPLDANLDSIAWYCANSQSSTHPVGSKLPNAWGLYDTSGNVLEWTWDWYAGAYPGAQGDPEGPDDGSFRVVRGGASRFQGAARCRSAYRSGHTPGYRNRYIGIRLARTLSTGETAYLQPLVIPPATEPPRSADRDLPDSLPFDFTRDDPGEALTPEEISAFTQKITAFWGQVEYFHWVLWHSHGMDASNPEGMPDYKLWWQDTRAIKDGDIVTFQHVGGADNIMIRTPKVLNNAGAGYLLSGDPVMGQVVEQYSKGVVALFQGMMWGDEDPEDFIMARAIFTQDHTYVEEGRQAAVDYGPVKMERFDWNAHTVNNPQNPYWGDIWVRTKRSKDDVPHIFRSAPLLARVAAEGQDESVREAAALALSHIRSFARDIVDSGYHIRTKNGEGDTHVPRDENGIINDLASFVLYEVLVSNAECNAKLTSALIAYDKPLENDCGNGIGSLYELVASYGHYFNYAIIRYFHVSAITNALMAGQNQVALTLLEGLALRLDAILHNTDLPHFGNADWYADAASILLVSATAGLPLTSEETRLIHEEYGKAVDHYETWPNWDLWDPSVPDGVVEYKPSRYGELGNVVRPEELTYLIEYCYSPFRNETGAPLVDCEIIGDPNRWGE